MKALRALLFVLLIGFVAHAADAPQSAPSVVAAGLCRIDLGNISRAVPPASDRPAMLNDAQRALSQLRSMVENGEKQQRSGQILARPQWPSSPQAARPVEGGVVWHFDESGESHGGKNYSPSDYRKLQQMLTDASKVLESGDHKDERENPVSYFVLNDRDQIEKFLKTNKRVETPDEIRHAKEVKLAKEREEAAERDRAQRDRTDREEAQNKELKEKRENLALVCMWAGGGAGLLGGIALAFPRHPNRKLDQEIIAKAEQTVVKDRETHLALLREAWRDRSDKEEAIKKHIAQLDALEKLGVKLQFGGRYSDYLPSLKSHDRDRDDDGYGYRRHYYDDSSLDPLKLATRERRPINEDTLEYEAGNPRDARAFTSDEINERLKRGHSDTISFFAGAGEAIASAGITGGLAWAGCTAAGGKLIAVPATTDPAAQVGSMQVPAAPPTVSQSALSEPGQWQPDANPPPELEPFRQVVDAAFSPDYRARSGSPKQVLLTGANTNDGLHTLLFLVVDNTANPPRMKLVGMGYRTSVDYAKPPDPVKVEEPPPAVVREKPLDLKRLHDRLVNAHFQNQYLDELGKLDEVFNLASNMRATGKLDGDDARQFQQQIDQLIASQNVTDDNLRGLKRFLMNVQARRSRQQ